MTVNQTHASKKYGVIKVRIPEEELKNLNRRVARVGISREEYVRRALAGHPLVEAPPADYRLILRKLDEIHDELEDVIRDNPSIANNMRLIIAMQNLVGTANALLQVMHPRENTTALQVDFG